MHLAMNLGENDLNDFLTIQHGLRKTDTDADL